MNSSSNHSPLLDDGTRAMLREIARRHGTPTYAFDLLRVRAQVAKLRTHLPAAVEILYSLKANASLGICDTVAACGVGADVASAGELVTAAAAGFSAERIFVAGPFKLPDTVRRLHELPAAIVSADSFSELRMLAAQRVRNRVVLRLRPDFSSSAVVAAGRECRFGFTADDLVDVRKWLATSGITLAGFHVYAGSQVLLADRVIEHLRGALELSLRAADMLAITPTILNLGGGFGIPYGPDDDELDLSHVADALRTMHGRAGAARLVLELGRYLIAQAGWYLTSVLGFQSHQGRPAVVVDGGVHQRADLCGLCLRFHAGPVALDADRSACQATDVLGCLSLPADVLAESTPLPPLEAGQVLAFPNAGAYGLWSSPALFHASPLPAEAAFDGSNIALMRERQAAESILDGQRHVRGPLAHDATRAPALTAGGSTR